MYCLEDSLIKTFENIKRDLSESIKKPFDIFSSKINGSYQDEIHNQNKENKPEGKTRLIQSLSNTIQKEPKENKNVNEFIKSYVYKIE